MPNREVRVYPDDDLYESVEDYRTDDEGNEQMPRSQAWKQLARIGLAAEDHEETPFKVKMAGRGGHDG